MECPFKEGGGGSNFKESGLKMVGRWSVHSRRVEGGPVLRRVD